MQDGKTAKCVLLLSEFNIKYVTQKSVKGRAIADHLAHCSPKEVEEIQGDFPDEDYERCVPQKKEIQVPFRAPLFLGKWYGFATYLLLKKKKKKLNT